MFYLSLLLSQAVFKFEELLNTFVSHIITSPRCFVFKSNCVHLENNKGRKRSSFMERKRIVA